MRTETIGWIVGAIIVALVAVSSYRPPAPPIPLSWDVTGCAPEWKCNGPKDTRAKECCL